jgi:hypothetical protein
MPLIFSQFYSFHEFHDFFLFFWLDFSLVYLLFTWVTPLRFLINSTYLSKKKKLCLLAIFYVTYFLSVSAHSSTKKKKKGLQDSVVFNIILCHHLYRKFLVISHCILVVTFV